jgi:hypothetical protein
LQEKDLFSQADNKMKIQVKVLIVFSMALFLTFSAPLVSAKVNIMPLGDSITRGSNSGAAGPDYFVSYRKDLWDSLEAAGYEANFVGSLIDGSLVPDFDADHEGHGGWTADQIAANIFDWLTANPANIVLLHIGSNDISGGTENALKVDDILDEIDRYETTFGEDVWVILAYIVNRSCDPYLPPCPKSLETTVFNNDVKTLVVEPRQNILDKIITVDMETGAGIDYPYQPLGDMWDDLHPFETGYEKMSDVWFSGLLLILPVADAGPDQSVDEFDTVTLDGSGSSDPKDPKGGSLSYLWEQTAGTAVVLSDEQSAQPTFTAPDVGPDGATLTFKLMVTDDNSLESVDTMDVTVHNPNSSSGGGGGGGGCFIATAGYGSTATDFMSSRLTLQATVRWGLLLLVGMGWVALRKISPQSFLDPVCCCSSISLEK